ncbi:MAG: hypothetical protein KQI62_00635 [Deltaproteobacteria bacterium]|nr:hypothetical protein [Deltaproteobacteria bacterium]
MSTTRAMLCFTPSLSRRLIAKGIASLPQVQKAFKSGKVLLSSGTTGAHIFVELTGAWTGGALACGMISLKGTCVGSAMSQILAKQGHAAFWFFEKGELKPVNDMDQALDSMGAEDVFIKGANALDNHGNVGVLLGVETGGLMGKSLGYVMARGIHCLLPGGLEKTVMGSIMATAKEMGTRRVDYTTGMPVGLVPVAGARFCEIEALSQLTGVEVFHAASGGSAGAEGSVVLLTKGEREQVERTMELYKAMREDTRFEGLTTEPSRCGEHKWVPCAKHNFLYTDNVKKGL